MRLFGAVFIVFAAAGVLSQDTNPSTSPKEKAAKIPPVQERVEVTTTRLPEDPHEDPAPIEVITGDELRARGATDLRTALSPAIGVEIAPGGDAGPASSVPAFWGLKEFDAFLLLVDGDRVIGLGIDRNDPNGSINVSLFDVSNMDAPKMINRVASQHGRGNLIETPDVAPNRRAARTGLDNFAHHRQRRLKRAALWTASRHQRHRAVVHDLCEGGDIAAVGCFHHVRAHLVFDLIRAMGRQRRRGPRLPV